jgi:dihydrolipoamide dehydrogenase
MTHDVIVIGAGAAGEAAGSLGAELGAKVAVVERDLVGGQCSFWACLPSKSLLDSAGRRAIGADYPWERASRRRDWMISREEIDYPNDASHVRTLEKLGAEVIRGTARIVGSGRVEVRFDGEVPRTLEAPSLIVCTGSVPVIPAIEGLESEGYWTSPVATSTRELPSSIAILGGGPVGVEMAQVFARFGVKTTIVESNERVLARDHPNSSKALSQKLAEEGVEMRTGVKARKVTNGGIGRRVELSDGSFVEASQILVAVGRRPADIKALGVEEAGVTVGEKGVASPDERMSVGKGVFVAGDVAGGLQFTHLADYEGRIAVRAALGQNVRADVSSVPRTTFTDPETGAIGLTQDEAREKGIDAFEVTQDFTATARGQTIEGSVGHVTAVVDRERKTLVGAFAACPGASELIHEAVLAIKQKIPVTSLADTIHAFPTGARVFGNLMADAAKRL